jgi:hypothetical protein
MNFLIENQETIIAVLIALGVPALLARKARHFVERMPTRWYRVGDRLVLKNIDKLLCHYFGEAVMLSNAKVDNAEAMRLLSKLGEAYIDKKNIATFGK